jgi:glycosyltransferase involved in cell wall biosynthesis
MIGFAGRLSPEKGVDVLLAAMPAVLALVPDARLLVAGDGPESRRLRRLAERLGITERTRFLGHVERATLDDVLAPAWVQAIPSRWEEPFGLVALEAMMRGTAVVASAVGGLGDSIVDGRTGHLVPPGDPAALADAVVRVLSSREEAESLGAAGRRRALSDFQESSLIDAFTRLYRELLA